MAISAPGRTPRGGWSAKHDQQARNAGYACWTGWIAAIQKDEDRKICGARAHSTQSLGGYDFGAIGVDRVVTDATAR